MTATISSTRGGSAGKRRPAVDRRRVTGVRISSMRTSFDWKKEPGLTTRAGQRRGLLRMGSSTLEGGSCDMHVMPQLPSFARSCLRLAVQLRTKGVRLVRGDPPLSEFRTQFSIAGVRPSPRHVDDRTGDTLAISPATRQSQPKGLAHATVCTPGKVRRGRRFSARGRRASAASRSRRPPRRRPGPAPGR